MIARDKWPYDTAEWKEGGSGKSALVPILLLPNSLMISSWIHPIEDLVLIWDCPKPGMVVRLRRSARRCLDPLATFPTFTIVDISHFIITHSGRKKRTTARSDRPIRSLGDIRPIPSLGDDSRADIMVVGGAMTSNIVL